MPYYSQEQDLNLDDDTLVELTDSPSAVGVKDEDLIERLGVEADADVDGLLAGKYITPVAAPPAILRYIHADIWRYKLYKHRPSLETPDDVVRDWKKSMGDLRDYARDDAFLAAPRVSAPTSPGIAGGALSSDAPGRLFGRCRDSLGS